MSQPLIISAGMPRAGSGWYYNLLHDLIVSDGGQDARNIRKKFHLERLLTEVNCNISTLRFYRLLPVFLPAYTGNKFVVKTHAGPTGTAQFLINRKKLIVTYIYRDPRAAMLSAYEYGQKGIKNNRPNAFSHLVDLEAAAEFIHKYLDIWEAWSRLDEVMIIRYEELLTNYPEAIDKTARALNLDRGIHTGKQVIEQYKPEKGDTGQIGTHFSKGEAERFRREIAPDQLEQFTRKFEPYLLRMGYKK